MNSQSNQEEPPPARALDSNRRQALLALLANLRPGTTVCPGLACRSLGSTLAAERSLLLAMAHEGLIEITQRGLPVRAAALRGPFRIRLPDGNDGPSPG